MFLHICSKIMKVSLTVQSFRTDTIFILKIPKKNNSEKKNGGVMVLVLSIFSMKLYICSKRHENIDDLCKVIDWIRFWYEKFPRSIILQKHVAGVTVFILYKSSYAALYLYQVSWKYPWRYQSYRADKIFIRKNSKGYNFTKILDGVTVVVLCTLFDTSLFFYPVSWKYLWRFLSCRADTIFKLIISKGGNSAIKCRLVMIPLLPTLSGDT